MNAPLIKTPMTVDEFVPWAMAQGGRWELIDGEPWKIPSETSDHRKLKAAVYVALRDAVIAAGVLCVVEMDGATVRIHDKRAYEPDALVYPGPELAGDSVEVPNPVILVEVLSPGTQRLDAGAKFRDYFSLPSVTHYLIVDPSEKTVLHHARAPDGRIVSAAISEGELVLDPPGITLAVSGLWTFR